MEATLIVEQGKYQGCEIPLPETIFLIGRDRQCHLRVHCELVSKRHCAIAAWAGKVRVRDLKSRNGTLLNDEPITKETTVHDGDRLQVGSLVFLFQIRNAAGPDVFGSPIDKQDVQWLLDSPTESGILSAGSKTAIHRRQEQQAAIPKDESSVLDDVKIGAIADAAKNNNGTAISAGKSLHEYFQLKQEKAAAERDKKAAGN